MRLKFSSHARHQVHPPLLAAVPVPDVEQWRTSLRALGIKLAVISVCSFACKAVLVALKFFGVLPEGGSLDLNMSTLLVEALPSLLIVSLFARYHGGSIGAARGNEFGVIGASLLMQDASVRGLASIDRAAFAERSSWDHHVRVQYETQRGSPCLRSRARPGRLALRSAKKHKILLGQWQLKALEGLEKADLWNSTREREQTNRREHLLNSIDQQLANKVTRMLACRENNTPESGPPVQREGSTQSPAQPSP